MSSRLQSFLENITAVNGKKLPIIHSTPSFFLRSIKEQNKILTSECDVFRGERLNYFFVGRPSYKSKTKDVGETPVWMLPACFIFEFNILPSIKRIFPFDSGAFFNKLYPDYITKHMIMEDFEIKNDIDSAPQKIIGAFFGDNLNYFNLKVKSETDFGLEHSLNQLEFEIKALHRLAIQPGNSIMDDRRLCIEVQSECDIDLSISKPLAVIAPDTFFQEVSFRQYIDNLGAEAIDYSLLPLNIENYYGSIYEKVKIFLTTKGYL